MIYILKEIANTSKSSEKKAILTKHKDNAVLKQIFEYCYHPDWVYGVKNAEPVEQKETLAFNDIWDYFVEILKRVPKKT